MKRLIASVVSVTLLSGCSSALTTYTPRLVAQGELTLRYDDGLQIWAGKKQLTDAPAFEGLSDYVRCVPAAREHAAAAESDGQAAIGTGITGGVLGVGSLSGLTGLAFIEEDETKMWALFGTGIAVGLLGISFALISRNLKNTANGHAVDALNYYNDEVGYYGGSCDLPRPKLRVVVIRQQPAKKPPAKQPPAKRHPAVPPPAEPEPPDAPLPAAEPPPAAALEQEAEPPPDAAPKPAPPPDATPPPEAEPKPAPPPDAKWW